MARSGPRVKDTDIRHAAMLYRRGFSTRAIAHLTEWSRGRVLRYLRAAGVEMRPAGRPRRHVSPSR